MKAKVLNALTALSAVAGVWMLLGGMAGRGLPLTSAGLWSLKYYTVLSNIFAGLAALYALASGSERAGTVKYAASVCVAVTFLVTACFLAPTARSGYFSMFAGVNFLLHFVTPVLCVVSLVIADRPRLSFGKTFAAVVPTLMYGMFYIVNVLTHLREDGSVDAAYDWYGFFGMGVASIAVVLPIILLPAWGIAVGLRAVCNGK